VEVRAVTASALRAQLDTGVPWQPRHDAVLGDRDAKEVVHPLVLAWRAGGDPGVVQHLWHAHPTDAEQRGVSEHDLAWAAVKCIVHFRFLSHYTPRPIALQVAIFALEGQLLPPIELRRSWGSAHGQAG
jgi:hypothetical protein